VKRTFLALSLVVGSIVVLAPQAAAIPPPVLTGVAGIAAGGVHSCAVTVNHQVACWGSNYDGEMGVGTVAEEESPTRYVLAPTGTGRLGGVDEVIAGYYVTCALLTNGQVRCWGYNGDGQVGNGSAAETIPRAKVVSNPTGTGPLTGVTQLTAGERHVCARLSNGQVRCWGDNDYGQLGTGGGSAGRPKVVRARSGTGPLTGVTQIDAGHSSTCARLSNGQAVCWGLNSFNILGGNRPATSLVARPIIVRAGNGLPLQGISQISIGYDNTCVRYSSGRAGCWGNGESSANGNGTQNDYEHAVFVKDSSNQAALQGVVEIEVGSGGACARRANKQVWCWGTGLLVGDGSGSESSTARAVRNDADTARLGNVSDLDVGSGHGCVATTGRRAFCWGSNYNEQVGPNDGDYTRATPVYAPPPVE
jgi:alpha-tubulin suppressor-like RCC1 family protein